MTRYTRPLYHVTARENVEAILRDGLRAGDDGFIYAIKEKWFAAEIALNQLGLEEYAVLKIWPRGIRCELGRDDVAELLAWNSVRLQQPAIEARALSLERFARATESDRRFLEEIKNTIIERAARRRTRRRT